MRSCLLSSHCGFLRKDLVAQRTLLDVAMPASLVIRLHGLDRWVSLIAAVTGVAVTDMDKQSMGCGSAG